MPKLIVIIICAFITFTNYGQFYSPDSIKLNKELDKYRRLLDNPETSISPSKLYTIVEEIQNQKKVSSSKPVIVDVTEPMEGNFNTIPNKYFNLPKPKYTFNQIIENDTSTKLFIETEYELNNRPMLAYIKDKFNEEKESEAKALYLLEYITRLNSSYPQYPDWIFSRSQTIWKYVRLIENTIKPLKRDSTKALLFMTIANALSDMDRVYWREYAFTDYLFAEKILTKPYDYLIPKNSSEDEAEKLFTKFILDNPHSATVANIYLNIFNILTPMTWYDKTNSLYPLDSKRKYYVDRGIRIMKILEANNRAIDKRYLMRCEQMLLSETTLRFIKHNNRYSNGVFAEYNYILSTYISQLFGLPENNLRFEHQKVLYKGLGDIFSNLNEPEYAIKAYLKSFENALMSTNGSIIEWEASDLFVLIFLNYKDVKKGSRLNTEKEYFLQLYKRKDEIVRREITSNTSVWARNIILESERLISDGDITTAKKLLLDAREKAIGDTTDNSNSLTILYDALAKSNWIPPTTICLNMVDRFDSLAYVERNTTKESNFDGNYYIEEILSRWNYVEGQANFVFATANLNDSIASKQMIIAEKENVLVSKENEIIRANLKIENLNSNISGKIEKIKSDSLAIVSLNIQQKELNTVVRNLKYDTTRLNSRVENLTSTISANKKTIEAQKSEIKNWVIGGVFAIILAILLPIIVGFIVGRIISKKKKIEIDKLNKIKAGLENDVKGLKSTLEMERELNETKLSLANNNIMTELTLKHEIKDILSSLHLGFESKFITQINTLTKNVAEEFNEYFKKLTSFSHYYYSLLKDNSFNTLDQEVELAKRYADFKKMEQNSNEVTFTDQRTYKGLDIPTPHHFLNIFSMNSLKKGIEVGKNLMITITDYFDKDEYVLKITDTGKGLPQNFNIKDLPLTSTGLRNALIQTDFYNSQKAVPYTLLFNENSVYNVENQSEKGTEVILKFIRKDAV